MADDDLLDLWIAGESPAAALCERALAEVERSNPALNAVLTVTPGAARARGTPLPLDGMPVTVKDNIDTAGVRTTAASAYFAEHVPNASAVVFERLLASGAVPIGKANLHEFALGATTRSPHLGACANPWKAGHVTGGSSGGSGASVAAGHCIASLGSDTGGSIRNPAAFNGVCGLKATHGRVPNRGSFPVSPPHDCIGPLAARVVDVARVYMAIAGYDREDPTSEDRPVEDVLAGLDDGVEGLRIGVPRTFYFDDVDAEVEAAVPALSLPCGFSPEGLPVGLQLVAPWWAEASLLRAGQAYQSVTDWHLRRPPRRNPQAGL